MEEARDPTDPEIACFETGIKFGSLYHQFAGTPVSGSSADALEAAMAAAIENQPHCTGVRVEIDREALAEAVGESGAAYTELTGRLLDVEIDVEYEGTHVRAGLRLTDGYPLMEITGVDTVASSET